MFKVINHEGVAVQNSYVVWDREYVYAFDAIGAEVGVKAIHAAAFGNGNARRFTFKGRANVGDNEVQEHYVLRPLPDVFDVERQTVLSQPNLYRWHFRPVVRPGDASIIVYGLREWQDFDEATGFYWGMLQTNYPMLREWAVPLLRLAREAELVNELLYAGNVTFAFELRVSEDWHALLNTAVRDGQIHIPTS